MQNSEVTMAPVFRNKNARNCVDQEIKINATGGIEIHWINPRATALVEELWEMFSSEKTFPVTVISGNYVYCG